jgi:hypothetical protein
MIMDSKRRWIQIVTGTIAVVAVVLGVMLATNHGTFADAKTGSPMKLTEAQTVLQQDGLNFAKANGDSNPTDMETVHGLAKDVLPFMDPGLVDLSNPSEGDLETDLVMMHGKFEGRMAKIPKGAEFPSGKNLWLIFDSATGEQMAWGIDDRDYDLTKLGSPQKLLP